jgi:diguanylate cyclase (GGDEF)-like protein
MDNQKIYNRIWFTALCLLIAANALLWAGVHRNIHEAGHADRLTDHYEDLIVDMDDATRRTHATHLYTMDTFLDMTAELFEKGNFPDGVTAMISFDGDGMGKKNDEFGQESVDRLIEGFADVVKKHFPDSDMNIVSNVGEKSDEFYMLLLGRESKEDVIKEIEAFQEDIRGVSIPAADGREMTGTVSIGIAFLEPGQTFESLFEEADQAAYEAKEAGKDCYCVSD